MIQHCPSFRKRKKTGEAFAGRLLYDDPPGSVARPEPVEHHLAVGAIANPRPVVLRDPSPEVLRDVIGRYPYNAFPLVIDGVLSGVVFREQILSALHAGTPPEVRKAVTCHPDQTVREVGDMFIESPGNVLVVVAREDGSVRGIITLHDLIRAQAAVQA